MAFLGRLRERLVHALAGDAITAAIASAALPSAPAAAATRAREAVPTSFSLDDQKLMAAGFRRLSSNGGLLPLRDLQPLAQDRMLQLVFWLWEANPVAQWLVETTVDFVLGEGMTITSEHDDIQATIDALWNDPVNQLDRRVDAFLREFGLYGELCLPVAVNEIDGHVRLGYVDPLEIDAVITDPENALLATAVVLKARAQTNKKRVLKVIREDTARVSPYFGMMMPALTMERDPVLDVAYDGSCFLFQTNKLSNGRRGRSDLLALIDWLDGYDQFLFDSMDSANLFNSFVYDAKLEGFTEPQIEEWLTKFGRTLKKGGVFAHNEKVTLGAVAPDLKALDKDAFARLYRGHILGARSYPEHWFGLAGEVNFASAKEMGLPPVKRLTRRQKEFRFILGDLVRFQLHQKIRVGALPLEVVIGRADADGNSTGKTKRTDQAFTIVLPELSMRDQASTVAAVTSLVAALIQAEDKGWVRPETSAKLFANLVSQLGMEIDAAEEFDPNAAKRNAMSDYSPGSLQQILERLQAQLGRQGNGNGDNINEPKPDAPGGGGYHLHHSAGGGVRVQRNP